MRRFIQQHHRLLTFALLVALVCALLVPAVALARAGGGHTSNSGSSSRSSGSSSRSSGSGGGSAGSFLGGAAVGSALSGGSSGGSGGCCTTLIIIAIIVVAYIVITKFFGGGKGGGTPGDSDPPVDFEPDAPANFDQLKADDPLFSEQAFYGRTNEMFLAIQKAWELRNMEPARRFLAEQQFQVLADGVGEYVRNGQINKLDSIHIDRVTPVSVTREGGSDYVKVLITASVIDYTIDERSGQIVNPGVLGDGKTVKTFDEYWTLVRKVGAQTKADATIKKCPNCGGPVTDGNYVKCAYCGTMMNDPALDWVLLRIEQP
jgi:predicted lipid-binding transport protein (Tim44 family)